MQEAAEGPVAEGPKKTAQLALTKKMSIKSIWIIR
jgi:hypothetical protein